MQLFLLLSVPKKNSKNASVRLLFCHISENMVYSFILNIAVTVKSHTRHNDEWVKISQKTSDSLWFKPC